MNGSIAMQPYGAALTPLLDPAALDLLAAVKKAVETQSEGNRQGGGRPQASNSQLQPVTLCQ
jgi:hypothetical protein